MTELRTPDASLGGGDESRAGLPALGRELIQRSSEPGVVPPHLSRDLAGRTAGVVDRDLAAEIRRRWSPGAAGPWEHGGTLPLFAGWPLTPAGAEAGPGAPSAPARSVPAARTVGAAPGGPAATALAPLGSRLQRRHAGGTPVAAVRRRDAAVPAMSSPAATVSGASSPSVPEFPGAVEVQSPTASAVGAPAAAPAAGGLQPAILRRAAAGPSALPAARPAPAVAAAPAAAPWASPAPSPVASVEAAPFAIRAGQETVQRVVRRMAADEDEEPETSASSRPVIRRKREEGTAGARLAPGPRLPRPAAEMGPPILRRAAAGPSALPAARPAPAVAATPAAAPWASPASSPVAPAEAAPLAIRGAQEGTVQRAVRRMAADEDEEPETSASSRPVIRRKREEGTAGARSAPGPRLPRPAAEMGPPILRRDAAGPSAPPVVRLTPTVAAAPAAAPWASPASSPVAIAEAAPLAIRAEAATVRRAVSPAAPRAEADADAPAGLAGALRLQRGSAATPPPVAGVPGISGLTAVTAGLAMPLARPAGSSMPGGTATIQRQTEGAGATGAGGGERSTLGDTAGSGGTAGSAAAGAAAGGTAAPQTDEDELAERVLRRLMRTLAVEGERRGMRRWP